MVNNTMDNSSENKVEESTSKNATPPPNETSSFTVHGHVKIFDPETHEVFVEKRA